MPLLLVHGAGGSGRHWRWVMERLPPGIRAIAVDLPGHGRSGGYVPRSVEAAAELLDDFLDRVGVEGPVAVVGHSIGGVVSLRLALARPARVGRLGLVASAAHVTPHPLLLRQLTSGEIDEAFVRRCFSAGVPEDRQRIVVDDLRRVRLAPGAADFMDAAGCDLRPHLASLTMPALVVSAPSDPVISARKSRMLAQQLPCARLLTIDAGHYIHVERPGDVAEAISTFIQPA
jgi:pimeloyl-ACP methyl ester carboxylesterase